MDLDKIINKVTTPNLVSLMFAGAIVYMAVSSASLQEKIFIGILGFISGFFLGKTDSNKPTTTITGN